MRACCCDRYFATSDTDYVTVVDVDIFLLDEIGVEWYRDRVYDRYTTRDRNAKPVYRYDYVIDDWGLLFHFSHRKPNTRVATSRVTKDETKLRTNTHRLVDLTDSINLCMLHVCGMVDSEPNESRLYASCTVTPGMLFDTLIIFGYMNEVTKSYLWLYVLTNLWLSELWSHATKTSLEHDLTVAIQSIAKSFTGKLLGSSELNPIVSHCRRAPPAYLLPWREAHRLLPACARQIKRATNTAVPNDVAMPIPVGSPGDLMTVCNYFARLDVDATGVPERSKRMIERIYDTIIANRCDKNECTVDELAKQVTKTLVPGAFLRVDNDPRVDIQLESLLNKDSEGHRGRKAHESVTSTITENKHRLLLLLLDVCVKSIYRDHLPDSEKVKMFFRFIGNVCNIWAIGEFFDTVIDPAFIQFVTCCFGKGGTESRLYRDSANRFMHAAFHHKQRWLCKAGPGSPVARFYRIWRVFNLDLCRGLGTLFTSITRAILFANLPQIVVPKVLTKHDAYGLNMDYNLSDRCPIFMNSWSHVTARYENGFWCPQHHNTKRVAGDGIFRATRRSRKAFTNVKRRIIGAKKMYADVASVEIMKNILMDTVTYNEHRMHTYNHRVGVPAGCKGSEYAVIADVERDYITQEAQCQNHIILQRIMPMLTNPDNLSGRNWCIADVMYLPHVSGDVRVTI